MLGTPRRQSESSTVLFAPFPVIQLANNPHGEQYGCSQNASTTNSQPYMAELEYDPSPYLIALSRRKHCSLECDVLLAEIL